MATSRMRKGIRCVAFGFPLPRNPSKPTRRFCGGIGFYIHVEIRLHTIGSQPFICRATKRFEICTAYRPGESFPK
jgi:hypothetical protein